MLTIKSTMYNIGNSNRNENMCITTAILQSISFNYTVTSIILSQLYKSRKCIQNNTICKFIENITYTTRHSLFTSCPLSKRISHTDLPATYIKRNKPNRILLTLFYLCQREERLTLRLLL